MAHHRLFLSSQKAFCVACLMFLGLLLVLNMPAPTAANSETNVTESNGLQPSTIPFVAVSYLELHNTEPKDFTNQTNYMGVVETSVESLSTVENFTTTDLRLDQPLFAEDVPSSSSETLYLYDDTNSKNPDPTAVNEEDSHSVDLKTTLEWIINGTTSTTPLESGTPDTKVEDTESGNDTQSYVNITAVVDNYTISSVEVPVVERPSPELTTLDVQTTSTATTTTTTITPTNSGNEITTNWNQEAQETVITTITGSMTSSEDEDVSRELGSITNDIVSPTRTSTYETSSSSISETTVENSDTSTESETSVTSAWYVLIIQGNCSLIPLSEQEIEEQHFESLVTNSIAGWLNIAKEDISVTEVDCGSSEYRIQVNLTIFQRPDSNITAQMSALEESKNPFLDMYGQNYYVYQIVTVNGFLNKDIEIPTDLRHSDVELLIYITVGSVCTFLLVLALGLLACKYCDCKEPKPFELGDAPNLNMRLEDYTLTQIPRPKLGYTDYCRGLAKRYSPLDDQSVQSPNGMVQPFDTSVVPLEDARVLDSRSAPFREYHDGIIVRPLEIPRLGGSLGRMCHGSRPGTKSHFFYTMDVDGFCLRSTENLNATYPTDRYVEKGVDNPNFQ